MSVYGRFLAASLSLPQGGEWHPFKRKAAAAHPFRQKAAGLHPFKQLAGAQHPFDPTPGAWHPFVSRGGAMHPFDPAGVGLHPFVQLAAGLHPFAAQAASASAGDDALPSPWLGIDPDWVYGSAEALQAQAMRRVSTELGGLVAPPDPDDPSAVNKTDALWRWGVEFRGKALIAELASRVLVHDKQLKLVPMPGCAAVDALTITLAASLTEGNWADQIDKVLRAAVEREDRLPEILTQAGSFWDYFGMASGLNLELAPRTAELIDVASEWATLVVMALKNQHAVLRPMQRSPLVMPVIETPAHGALPSGHATVSRLYADLLTELLYAGKPQPLRERQLDVLARRVAFNRVVAGVHFQADSVAGHHLGRFLARSLISLARGGQMQLGWTLEIASDASLGERESKEPACIVATDPTDIGPAPQFKKLWDAAVAELADLRV